MKHIKDFESFLNEGQSIWLGGEVGETEKLLKKSYKLTNIHEGRNKILSFTFNTDNISLDDVKDIVQQYTKNWRTSGDISEVSMYVTLGGNDAKELEKELKSYGYFYDFEIDDSKY